MTKQLSNAHEYATEETNTTGVLSPILTISPEDGVGLEILGMIAKGKERGFPIYGQFKDGSDDFLPEDTTFAVQYEAPGMDDARTVTHPLDHIRPYNALTLNEQQDEEKIDAVKHVLKNTDQALQEGEVPTVGIRDIDELRIVVNASSQIDWSNSRLYIDRNAVREV